MSKLNPDLPIILIDTSYWLYYRFFSLRNWYARAYPEKYLSHINTTNNTNNTITNLNKSNFNIEHNWLEDEIFMSKYKKLFVENIKKLCKIFKTKMENVVFCIDCSHNNIWRHKTVNTENEKIKIKNIEIINNINNKKNIVPSKTEGEIEGELELELEDVLDIDQHIEPQIEPYKGTRLDSHKKNNFNSFNIFSYMKSKFIPTIKDNNNNNIKILHCSQCEADDIIGQFSIYINNKWNSNDCNIKFNTKKLYILANDNDYLQICNENIKLINGLGKIISGNENKDDGYHNYCGDKYLLSKVLIGDRSDNIKCCAIDIGYCNSGIPNNNFKNITKNNIKKIFENPEIVNLFYTMLNNIRNNNGINYNDNNYNNETTFKYFNNINKFKHNCMMMDFQMLPLELKENLYKLFIQII